MMRMTCFESMKRLEIKEKEMVKTKHVNICKQFLARLVLARLVVFGKPFHLHWHDSLYNSLTFLPVLVESEDLRWAVTAPAPFPVNAVLPSRLILNIYAHRQQQARTASGFWHLALREGNWQSKNLSEKGFFFAIRMLTNRGIWIWFHGKGLINYMRPQLWFI